MAAATTSGRNRRPVTAAVASDWRARSGSSESRRVTTSRTVAGTWSGSPCPSRASSTRKNGLPPERACQASTSGVGHVGGQPVEEGRGALAVEPGDVDASGVPPGERLADQGQGTGRARAGRAGCRPRTAAASGGGGGQQVGQRAQGGLVGPVQVLEHDQQRVGRALPRARGGRSRPSGRTRPAAGVARRRRRSSGSSGSPSASSTERHGHSGGAPSSCEQRPTATVKPRRRARRPGPRPAGTCRCRAPPPPGPRRSRRRQPRRAARPARRARGRGRPGRAVGRRVRRRRGGAGWPQRRAAIAGAARVRSISGDWRSTADSRARSRGPGSMPSSSASVVRTVRSASSASACRPARARASAWVAHSPSRSGCRAVADSVVASTPAWSPTASSPSSRASSAAGAQLLERGPLGLHVGVVGQVGVRLPRPRRQRGVEPVDRGDDRLARRPAGPGARLELRRQRGQHPLASLVPPRRRRARRPTRAAPAARSRGRWSR